MQDSLVQLTVERPDAPLSSRADVVIIRLAGELGLGSMVGRDGQQHTGVAGDTALIEALQKAVPNPPPRVVVDLSAVSFLSSLGIGALLRFQKSLAEQGSELRLAGGGAIVTVLRRCRLDQVLTLFPDVPSALKP